MAARLSLTENERLLAQSSKRCSKCRSIKQLKQFHKDKSSWGGYASLCRSCNNGHATDYYETHRVEIMKKARTRWLASFGLTEETYLALQQQQQFRCKICRNTFTTSKDMHIDHCHKTGRVRGLLCRGCNQALGMVRENTSTLQAKIAYLSV